MCRTCDLTWRIMTKCILKKNWNCSAAALELTLASCFIRQFMRLIVHFYSDITFIFSLSCLFLLCKSLNMCALAETHVVCVTTASPFLSYQLYIPSIIHISKTNILFVYIHFGRLRYIIKLAQKKRNPRLCNFSHNCIFKIARLLCWYPENNGSLQSWCTFITHDRQTSALRWRQEVGVKPYNAIHLRKKNQA